MHLRIYVWTSCIIIICIYFSYIDRCLISLSISLSVFAFPFFSFELSPLHIFVMVEDVPENDGPKYIYASNQTQIQCAERFESLQPDLFICSLKCKYTCTMYKVCVCVCVLRVKHCAHGDFWLWSISSEKVPEHTKQKWWKWTPLSAIVKITNQREILLIVVGHCQLTYTPYKCFTRQIHHSIRCIHLYTHTHRYHRYIMRTHIKYMYSQRVV